MVAATSRTSLDASKTQINAARTSAKELCDIVKGRLLTKTEAEDLRGYARHFWNHLTHHLPPEVLQRIAFLSQDTATVITCLGQAKSVVGLPLLMARKLYKSLLTTLEARFNEELGDLNQARIKAKRLLYNIFGQVPMINAHAETFLKIYRLIYPGVFSDGEMPELLPDQGQALINTHERMYQRFYLSFRSQYQTISTPLTSETIRSTLQRDSAAGRFNDLVSFSFGGSLGAGDDCILLPPEIGLLKRLTHLYVDSRSLLRLPNEVGMLDQLELLDASFNELTHLPDLSRLKKLKKVDLQTNRLGYLPTECKSWTSLEVLHLDDNQFTTPPIHILGLPRLKDLQLSCNHITSLPLELTNLKLTRLGLGANRITVLPHTINKLKGTLKFLDVSDNRLTNLPAGFGELDPTCEFQLSGNPLLTIRSPALAPLDLEQRIVLLRGPLAYLSTNAYGIINRSLAELSVGDLIGSETEHRLLHPTDGWRHWLKQNEAKLTPLTRDFFHRLLDNIDEGKGFTPDLFDLAKKVDIESGTNPMTWAIEEYNNDYPDVINAHYPVDAPPPIADHHRLLCRMIKRLFFI